MEQGSLGQNKMSTTIKDNQSKTSSNFLLRKTPLVLIVFHQSTSKYFSSVTNTLQLQDNLSPFLLLITTTTTKKKETQSELIKLS